MGPLPLGTIQNLLHHGLHKSSPLINMDTKDKSLVSEAKSLWSSLEERTSNGSSWTMSREELLPAEVRKNITTVTVVKSKRSSGLNARINFTDGTSAIYGLDIDIQELAELGDQLRPLTLKLREYISPDGEKTILRLTGSLRG